MGEQNFSTRHHWEAQSCLRLLEIWNNMKSVTNSQWSVRVADRLVLPTSDHGVAGSNPAGGEILPEPKRRFIA